jgi:hypothetical protein
VRLEFPRSALPIGLAVQLAASPRFAATGTMVTTGPFRLNHATVRSNATLFESALGAASARMDLVSGTRLKLEVESAGRFLEAHLMLACGAARIERAPGWPLRLGVGG